MKLLKTTVALTLSGLLLVTVPYASASQNSAESAQTLKSTDKCDWTIADIPKQLEQRAVVYVHGWQSSAQDMALAVSDLQQELGTGYKVLAFDYSSQNRQWPVGAANSRCLADFITEVSKSQRSAGSSAGVLAIGHSMGGIALREASTVLADQDNSEALAGVVTLGTPHLGSPLGGIAASEAFQEAKRYFETWSLTSFMPPENSTAAKCLGSPLPDGCSSAPDISEGITSATLGTQIFLVRRLFDLPFEKDPVEIPVFGDGIVPLNSANGYRSGAGTVTDKDFLGSAQIECRADTSYFSIRNAVLQSMLQSPFKAGMAQYLKGTLTMFTDSAALDAAAEGKFSAAQIPWLVPSYMSECFHTHLPTYAPVVSEAADFLREMNAQLPAVVAAEKSFKKTWLYELENNLDDTGGGPKNAALGDGEGQRYPSSTVMGIQCEQTKYANFELPENAASFIMTAGIAVPNSGVGTTEWTISLDEEFTESFVLERTESQSIEIDVEGASELQISVTTVDGTCLNRQTSSQVIFGDGRIVVPHDLEVSNVEGNETFGWPTGVDDAAAGFKAWIGAAAMTGRTSVGPLKWSTSSGNYFIGGDGELIIIAKKTGGGFENVAEGTPDEPASDTLARFEVPKDIIAELLDNS